MENIEELIINELKALDTVPAKDERHYFTTIDGQGGHPEENHHEWADYIHGKIKENEAVKDVIPANCRLGADYDSEANVLHFYIENISGD